MTTLDLVLDPAYVGDNLEPFDFDLSDAAGGNVDYSSATALTFEFRVDQGAVQSCPLLGEDLPNGIFRIDWTAAATARAGMLRGTAWFTLYGRRLVAANVRRKIIEPNVPLH